MSGTSNIEQDFLNAIERIRSRSVTHPQLVALQIQNKLKLTAKSAALEAGHSRTHIAKKDCALPAIRALIYPPRNIQDAGDLSPGGGTRPETTQEHIARLIRERREEAMAKRILATKLAEATQLLFKHTKQKK